jgi:hypothetical protein
MNLLKKTKKRFRGLTVYFLTCCIFFSLPFSSSLAGPKGKALGHNNPNAGVNPVDIITGSGAGGIKGTVSQNGIGVGGQQLTGGVVVTNPSGHVLKGPSVNNNGLGNVIVVQVPPIMMNKPAFNKVKNKAYITGQGLILAAGDAFSAAIGNPGHGKGHWVGGENPAGGVDFNPGGGNGKGHWGEGNKGNGVGNTWVGNQGNGKGGGMAGGNKCEPEPPVPPDPHNFEEPEDNTEAAPLDKHVVPSAEGCPALLEAVSSELGVTKETIQVSIGSAFATSVNIQPCESLAKCVNAAAILRDEGGVRMAAIKDVFDELAPADAPFTPVMAAEIVTKLAEHVNDGTHYAAVIEYLDAFVEYIRILDDEMGSPMGDSMTFVMEKYGSDILENDNSNIAAFLIICLENSGTFGG